MVSLMQGSNGGVPTTLAAMAPASPAAVPQRPTFGQRKIPVTRLSEDARPLTPEEYMRYGHIVGRLRQTTTATATNVSR